MRYLAVALAITLTFISVDAQGQYPSQAGYAPQAPVHGQLPSTAAHGQHTAYNQWGNPQPYQPYQQPYQASYQTPLAQQQPYSAQPPFPVETADDGDAPLAGKGLLIGGGMSLALFYLSSAVSGAGLDGLCNVKVSADDISEATGVATDDSTTLHLCGDADVDSMYIPIAGPFITVSELSDHPMSNWPLDVAITTLGIGQLVGAGLMIGGMIRAATGDTSVAPVRIQPVVGQSGSALMATGSF